MVSFMIVSGFHADAQQVFALGERVVGPGLETVLEGRAKPARELRVGSRDPQRPVRPASLVDGLDRHGALPRMVAFLARLRVAGECDDGDVTGRLPLADTQAGRQVAVTAPGATCARCQRPSAYSAPHSLQTVGEASFKRA
jgi:hypothetical protein